MASTTSPHDQDVAQRRRRERKVWRLALVVSALVHAGVFLLWSHRPVPVSPFAAAGPRAGDDRAAPGSMQALNVRTPPARPVVPPPVPVPSLEPVEPVEFDEASVLEEPSLAGEEMGMEGPPGLEEGEGEGDGGTAESGRYRQVPPSPRGMIIPPTHDELRGREVKVWVFVDERGRVVADSTHLEPPTSDGDFNRLLIREASEWIFTPARKGGEPVASWFPYTISM
jgi:hypothetical protein